MLTIQRGLHIALEPSWLNATLSQKHSWTKCVSGQGIVQSIKISHDSTAFLNLIANSQITVLTIQRGLHIALEPSWLNATLSQKHSWTKCVSGQGIVQSIKISHDSTAYINFSSCHFCLHCSIILLYAAKIILLYMFIGLHIFIVSM